MVYYNIYFSMVTSNLEFYSLTHGDTNIIYRTTIWFDIIWIYQVVYNASLYKPIRDMVVRVENDLDECTPMRSKRSVTEVDMSQLAVLVWWSIKIFSQFRPILPCIHSNLSLCRTLSIQQW